MNRAPLSGIVLAFIVGILLAKYTDISFIIFWLAAFLALVLSILFLKRKTKFTLLLLTSILFLGGAFFKNSQSLPPNHISNFTPYKGTTVYIEGVIDSDPIIKTKVTTFVFKVCRAGLNLPYKKNNHSFSPEGRGNRSREVSGEILVKVFGREDFLYGDRLLMEGTIYRVPYFRISKRLNYRDYLGQRGIYSILSLSEDSMVKLLDRKQGNPIKAFAFYMRHRMKKIVMNNISPLSGSILNAIILGERERLPFNLREIMVQSGTVHIIAISGLHVGLVSFISLIVLKTFRIPKKVCYIITAFVLVLYCLLTGARTPVIRVTIMAITLFFGYISGRQKNIYNILSLAALIILFYNPQQLFNISFQLSFISILSIIWLSPKIIFLFAGLVRKNVLITLFSASLAAWIGLFPLIAYYFNIISPIAILANMVVVPYLSIIIGSALAFLFIGFIYPPFTSIFSALSESSIIFLVKFISFLVRIPGAYFYLPDMSFSRVIWYYLFMVIIGTYIGQKGREAIKN